MNVPEQGNLMDVDRRARKWCGRARWCDRLGRSSGCRWIGEVENKLTREVVRSDSVSFPLGLGTTDFLLRPAFETSLLTELALLLHVIVNAL